MDKLQTVKSVMAHSGGIAKTAELIAAGLSKWDVYQLKNSGVLENVRHGYYQLVEDNDISEERLLAELLPEGIVCVESALFYYGYSDFTPREWTVAIPRTISASKLKIGTLPFRAYYIAPSLHQLGKSVGLFDRVSLAVYDRERTICDCFKYRTRLDGELFSKAINAYVMDEQKNLGNLSKYAKEMGLFKKVTNVMEVMLGG